MVVLWDGAIVATSHEHVLLLLGYLQVVNEPSATGYPMYWCRLCGSSALRLGRGRYAMMAPEWTREMVGKEKDTVQLSKVKPVWTTETKPVVPAKPKPRQALGRGLTEIRAQHGKVTLEDLKALFGSKKEN